MLDLKRYEDNTFESTFIVLRDGTHGLTVKERNRQGYGDTVEVLQQRVSCNAAGLSRVVRRR